MRIKKIYISWSLLISYVLLLVGVTGGLGITYGLCKKYKSIKTYENELRINIQNLFFDEKTQYDTIDDLVKMMELFPAEYKEIFFNEGEHRVSVVFTDENGVSDEHADMESCVVYTNVEQKNSVGDVIKVGEDKYKISKIVFSDYGEGKACIYWDSLDELHQKNIKDHIGQKLKTIDGVYSEICSDDDVTEELDAFMSRLRADELNAQKVDIQNKIFVQQNYMISRIVFALVSVFGIIYCIFSNIVWMREEKLEYIIRRVIGYGKYKQISITVKKNMSVLVIALPISAFAVYVLINMIVGLSDIHTFAVSYLISVAGIIIGALITITVMMGLFYKKHVSEEMILKKGMD